MPVIARLVVVAKLRSELPRSVVEPRRLEATELKAEEMVVEPVIARALPVALVKSMATKCEVEEAKIPLVALRMEEVAAVRTP